MSITIYTKHQLHEVLTKFWLQNKNDELSIGIPSQMLTFNSLFRYHMGKVSLALWLLPMLSLGVLSNSFVNTTPTPPPKHWKKIPKKGFFFCSLQQNSHEENFVTNKTRPEEWFTWQLCFKIAKHFLSSGKFYCECNKYAVILPKSFSG